MQVPGSLWPGHQCIVLKAWQGTDKLTKHRFLDCLEDAFCIDLLRPPHKPIQEEVALADSPLEYNHATRLTRAVDNIKRVIHGDAESADNSPFAAHIDFGGGSTRLRSIEVNKLHFVDRAFQGPCKELF